MTPYASVQFTYENRSDNPSLYQGGVLARPHPKRLSHIKTYVGATLVRGTTLTYEEVGPALQSRLVQIASCDANGNCQEPVQFGRAVEGMIDDGISAFVELGPHPILRYAVMQTAEAARHEVTDTRMYLARKAEGR